MSFGLTIQLDFYIQIAIQTFNFHPLKGINTENWQSTFCDNSIDTLNLTTKMLKSIDK